MPIDSPMHAYPLLTYSLTLTILHKPVQKRTLQNAYLLGYSQTS